MSEESEVDTTCCACCGIAEIDDIKLVPCDSCDLVKYCSDDCRENHKSEHKEDCKQRATELRDELLFKQTESSCLGDCPICMLPLPFEIKKFSMMACCSKIICKGCVFACQIREIEGRLQPSCPFCREPVPSTMEDKDKQRMKRVGMNDPAAMRFEGVAQYEKGDYRSAFEYWTKAAELDDALSHYNLSCLYRDGKGVEKDEGKKIQHREEAAIGGHVDARFNLGAYEWNNGHKKRAVKHWIIAATLGEDDSIKQLMGKYREGYVSKEDLDAALRAHKAAVDATKSPQRKAADEFQMKRDAAGR